MPTLLSLAALEVILKTASRAQIMTSLALICIMATLSFKCEHISCAFQLGSLITWGQFWPSGIVVACVCVYVCVCFCVSVNHEFVRAITNQPFKLGWPNLDQSKRPWLRALLFCGMVDHDLQGQIEPQSQNLPHFELVHAITHHQLKLQFPNLKQECI